MGLSLLPELSAPVIAGGGSPLGGAVAKRQRCEILRGTLDLEKGTFLSHWRELSDYILPRRARFVTTDVNKGDKRNQKIIDSTATEAAGILSAGMMAGVTSPARPWFRLAVDDPALAEQDDVKEWLHEVQRRMETVFLHSNLYNKLPILYGDIGVFGTSAMAVLEDDEAVIRCYDFPVGSYAIANDAKLRVRTFLRTFRLSVQQVVEKWGRIDATGRADFQRGEPTVLSLTVQNLWSRNDRVAWVDIVHVVQPNVSYDGRKIESRYKRFESIYYELGSPNQPIDPGNIGLLEASGFDEFPILCARWEVNSEDVYGTNCPGMKALGDIKALQTGEKRSAQAIEKLVNPPLTGPARLANVKVSVLPGDVTYDDVREGQEGLRPIYQVQFRVDQLEQKLQQMRDRIRGVFKADLFLMISQSDRREITAREIDERHEEKLLAVGPVLEQLNQDIFDPLINRTFNIMARKGLIPEAPETIQGANVRVEYVSIMAQAQKQIGLAGLERVAAAIAQMAQTTPDVLDRFDADEWVEQYADAAGVPPKILRSEDDANAIRQQRAKQQQLQQAAENAPNLAGAAKDLAATPTGGDTALAKLLGGMRARQTVNATAQPPASVV